MISLTITPPPSTNALFANVPGKGRVRTARYKAWADTAGWEIKSQAGGKTIAGTFAIVIWLPPGIDLDNCKAIADLLGPGKHGLAITPDDRHLVALHVYRWHQKNCRVTVEAVKGAPISHRENSET